MATGRCLAALSRRHLRSLLSSTPLFDSPQTLVPQSLDLPAAPNCASISFVAVQGFQPFRSGSHRYFSSPPSKSSGEEDSEEEEDEADDDDDDEEEEDEGEWEDECDDLPPAKVGGQSGKTEAERVKEAAEIGYKVIGPLDPSENPFKPYEPVFAVVQIGSHQFKTIVGRPILPSAAVHAVVEEHALDAKVIIFKKKRRKNYRRTKGHRQELTKLRITNIQGIDKSENTAVAA